MPFLSRITHNKEHVQVKVNFFADYFKYYNHYLGKNVGLFYENHLSLLEKINYHFKFNPNYRNNYLPKYFQHPYLQNKGFISRFQSFTSLEPLITEYLSLTKKKNTWIERHPDIIKYSIRLENELRENLLTVAIESLISYLYCKHKLRHHLNDILYITRIIVTELRFNRKNAQEIGEVISKIMSRDKKSFPLPKEVKKHAENENFDTIISDFFKNRTFNQQFEGILNFYNEENKEEYYLLRIHGIKVNNDFDFIYNDVRIISKYNGLLSTLKKIIKKEEFYKDFNKTRNGLIAYTTIKAFNLREGKKRAINKIKKAMDYINLSLNCNGSIDEDFCLTTPDFKVFGGIRTFTPKVMEIDNGQLKKLERENPFETLKNNKSPAAIQFLEFESLYHRALLSNEITDFWHYLECVIPKDLESKEVNKLVTRKGAKILMHGFKQRLKTHYKSSLFHSVDVHLREETGYTISYAERDEVWNNRGNSESFKVYKKLKNPFIDFIFREEKKAGSKNAYQANYNYFKETLNELYEIRNSFTHSGYKMDKLETKMVLIIPNLINRIRATILHEILESKRRNLHSVVEKIIKKVNVID